MVAESHSVHNTLVKTAQAESFKDEINTLKSGLQLLEKHQLASLAPFIDESGIMRVGGRIDNADVKYEQRHPIILDGKHHLAVLIVRHLHLQHCHAGNRLLYYLIHLKYWMVSATKVIKQVVYKCPICQRQRAKSYQQQMGELPRFRIVPAPVFSSVGVDYAGPVQVLAWKGRGNKVHKCWIAIFVCLATKAAHIELVTELTTIAFIAVLRRLTSRRGKPEHIYTDNGTNFTGANKYLIDLYNFLAKNKNQHIINTHLAEQGIQWHFIPPSGPHFGGIWEACVKSTKLHLNRVLKCAHPTYEEMSTLLCQIEMCLNSRPLCSKFKGDADPLTPAHFLLQRPLNAIPDEDNPKTKENYLSRWEYVQRLTRQFWKKWSMEYLHQLQQRPKWKSKLNNLAENDVVIIKDDNLPPAKWMMGRVIQLHPGKDGLVRVATVKTAVGEFKRPIQKLCPFLVNC